MKEKNPNIAEEIAEDLRKILGMRKRSLKHHMIGLEAEFMIIDSDGNVSHSADKILEKIPGNAKKECANNMIEIDTFPSRTITGTMHDMLERTQQLLDAMEKMGYMPYFYGTYPGKFSPSMRKKGGYGIKEKIFGKERFKIAGRCIGFHCHYTLPRGMFDYISKHLKIFIKSRISQTMVGSYNMLVAMDPVFTTFAQSSPYYEGRLYGKDSRLMFYRGSRIFGVDGLYSDFHDFGGLPPYHHTLLDIMHLIDDRFREWSLLIKKLGINIKTLALYGSVLDTNWSPVKINPNGTFEMRGMDMNRFEVLASLAVTMKFILKSIHEDYVNVVDSDIAIREPFKMEGDRIFIPPYSYVYNVLQRDSALYGMESPDLRLCCSRFLKLASKILPSDRKKFLKPLKEMVQKKKTVSDEIISEARKIGYKESLPNKAAADIALRISRNIEKDIENTKKLVSRLAE
ncbi:MAG: hypothetical protein HYW26_04155 [Candidatus Aenigmarchaeota archaeon]|nr:hypothetical protein [Candidatus Aenigmarchaeota archaeon]